MLYSEKIQYFIELVRQRSFSRAAKKLGVVTSTVTKAITNLEAELDATLVKRLKSGVELTEVGQDLFDSVIESYLNIEHKFNSIKDSDAKNQESIKIITTAGSMVLWIVERLKIFQEKHPNVTVHLQTIDSNISLSKTDADVAILPTVEDLGSIAKKKLFSVSVKLAASKGYIEKYGEPKVKSDLKNHRLISYYHVKDNSRGNVDWHLQVDGEILKPALVINSAICIYYAALQGYGIAPIGAGLPIEGDLVEILPDESPSNVDVFFMTPKRTGNLLIDDLYSSVVGGLPTDIKIFSSENNNEKNRS